MVIFRYWKLYHIRRWKRTAKVRYKYYKLLIAIGHIYFCIYSFLTFIMLKDKCMNVHSIYDRSVQVMNFLKLDCYFMCSQLLDLVIVDRLELINLSQYRFEYIYVLNSILYNIRVFVRGHLKPFSFVNSAIKLFSSVNWLEREA